MALVKGTNCGFVTTAPTADPAGAATSAIDNNAFAFKDTVPTGAINITEIGWWCNNATEEANFEVGIYDHNSGDNNPEAVVGSLSQTNAKGTASGWKVVTGLNIPVTAGTIYWIAVQLDNTATDTQYDTNTDAGEKLDSKTVETALVDPWGVSNSTWGRLFGIYALVEQNKIPLDTRFIQKNIVAMGNTCTVTQVAVTIGTDEYRTITEVDTNNTSISCFVQVLSYEDEAVKQGDARNGDLIFWFDSDHNTILARSGNDVVRITWNSSTYEVKDVRPFYAIGDRLQLLEVRVAQI